MCKHKYHSSKLIPIASVLGLSALAIASTPLFASATASVSGQVEIDVEVESAIAMTITGNNDDGSYYTKSGTSYNPVNTFSPEGIAGSNLDGHDIPSTAVTGTSSSYTSILPNSIVNGSSENGFRSTITIYTNSAAGYNLTVRDSDSTTNLTHTDGTNYIPTTDSSLSAGTAGWNYDVTRLGTTTGSVWAPTADGEDTYVVENSAITAEDVTIDSLPTKTSGGRITYVDYNVATSSTQAAGVYTDTLVYTATADSSTSSDTMSISPASTYTDTATTITATTSLYTTESYASTTFYLLTADQYAEVQAGTDVSEVGGTTLTATRTSSTPVTYTVSVPSQATAGTYYVYADVSDYTENFTAELSVVAIPTTCAEAEPVEPGSAAGVLNQYTQDDTTFVKLYTSADKSSSACYTKNSMGNATWENASSLCTISGTYLPTREEFNSLVSGYSGGSLYVATDWSGDYWSATEYTTASGYYLAVNSSISGVYGYYKTNKFNVVCIVH